MKKTTKYILGAALLAAALVIGLAAAPARAAEADPAEDWMLETGISSGVAPGDYGGALPLTWHQAVRLASRALAPELAARVESLAWVDIYGSRHQPGDPVTWAELCNLAVYAATPAGQLPMGEAPLAIWRETGLVPGDAGAGDTLDRGDAARLLHAIWHEDYVLPACPVRLAAEEAYLRWAVDLVPVIAAVRQVPGEILRDFAADGWTLMVGREGLYTDGLWTGLLGVTKYGGQQVTVVTSGPVAHELGHYLDGKLGFVSQGPVVGALYDTEAAALGEAMGRGYCKTDEREFFAEAFAWYLDGGQRQDAPGTYDFLAWLEGRDWSA